MTTPAATAALKDLGFTPRGSCDPAEHISRYDPELPGFEFAPTAGLTLTQCSFESPERVELSKRIEKLDFKKRDDVATMALLQKTTVGVDDVRLTFVYDKLYNIDVSFLGGEGMAGIAANMEKAFPSPRRTAPLHERYLDGEHGWKVNDYGEGSLWTDAHTTVMLFTGRAGIRVRYFDQDQLSLLNTKDRLKVLRDTAQQNKEHSGTEF